MGCLTAVPSTRGFPVSGSPCWFVGLVVVSLSRSRCRALLDSGGRDEEPPAPPAQPRPSQPQPSQPQPSQAAQPRETRKCLLKHQDGNRTECSNWGLPPGDARSRVANEASDTHSVAPGWCQPDAGRVLHENLKGWTGADCGWRAAVVVLVVSTRVDNQSGPCAVAAFGDSGDGDGCDAMDEGA